MAEDYDDIRQSMQILFSTLPGERIMRPYYGCDLHAYLFENISDDLIADIRRAIADSVRRDEPRVEILSVVAQQDRAQPMRLGISVNYRVRGSSVTGQLNGYMDMGSGEGGYFA
ncbi:MAG: GPW/gp25 family protein [Burkholderiales bacterium]|nr:GPW/gp25 family protein [Burkholderiales bacterium]